MKGNDKRKATPIGLQAHELTRIGAEPPLVTERIIEGDAGSVRFTFNAEG